MNIIITNIGRRGYLVDFIKENNCFNGKVFVSDCDETASGLYGNCDEFFILPKPVDDEKKYVQQLLQLCVEKDIKIIIPVIDPEIFILSNYKEMFEEKGILVITSTRKVLEICYNKINMNEFLHKNNFNIIPTYDDINKFEKDLEIKKIDFPVFLKPIFGSGSVNSTKVNNILELRVLFKKGMLIQKYVDGEEFGIDIFNNNNLEPVRIVIKKKLAMRSGETDKSITVKEDRILELAKRLGNNLKHFGPLDCDILKENDKLYIIDINPRFGGGYPATHMSGVDFIKLIFDLYSNIEIKAEFNNYRVNQLTAKTIGICSILKKEDGM